MKGLIPNEQTILRICFSYFKFKRCRIGRCFSCRRTINEKVEFSNSSKSKSLELLDGDLLTGKLDLIAELYTQSNRELRWMRAFYYFYSPANRRKINDNINNLRIVSSHLGIRNNSWCCFS
jgi:hypothetical protein